MGYIYGKHIYRFHELGTWTRDDWANLEADKAHQFSQLDLRDRVFHEWKERKRLEENRDEYMKAMTKHHGKKCKRCGTDKQICIDHKTPVSKGGYTTYDNLQFLCRECNARKKDKLYYEWLAE